MVSALDLFQAATLDPAVFGVDVVSPDLDEAGQLAAALEYVERKVLPGTAAAVALPVRKALGNFSVTFTPTAIYKLFGTMAGDEVMAQWRDTEISFGRSELNKRLDTNAKEYDADSDQDRIQGNQRLKTLIDYVTAWRENELKGMPKSGGRFGVSVSTAPHYNARNALLYPVSASCEEAK